MGERSVQRDKRAPLALALILVMAGSGSANGPYFLQSGPPPLRFGERHSDKKPALLALFPPKTAATNAAVLPETEANASSTNTAAEQAAPLVTGGTNALDGSDLNDVTLSAVSSSSLNSDAKGIPAGELLIVTPQMLADYLKPMPGVTVRAGTNGAANGDVLFRPPSPTALPSGPATPAAP